MHVFKSLPQGLALKFSLLKALCYLRGWPIFAGVTGIAIRFNHLDEALVFLVVETNISLEVVGFTLHVSIDLSPFVPLLIGNCISLFEESTHLVGLTLHFSLSVLQICS